MKLIADRECGDCSVCCRVLKIEAENLSKPAGQLCQHRSVAGCDIYPDRPYVCKQWHCMWRWFPFADNVRPDKSNILMSYEDHPELGHKVIMARDVSADGTAFNQPGFDAIIQSMLEQNIEVWCSQGGRFYKSTMEKPL